ncbi:MAG: cell division protein SepF [Clostridiaceae bacterium]
MSGVMNKIKGFIGLDDEDYDYEENQENVNNKENNEDIEPTYIQSRKQTQNKVVNIHTASSTKIVISKPKDYDEAMVICEELKNRRIIVVNTTLLEQKVAQRLLDFMSGACYVLGGELQEIERGVYVLSPSNVEISKEVEKELSNRGFLNWSR